MAPEAELQWLRSQADEVEAEIRGGRGGRHGRSVLERRSAALEAPDRRGATRARRRRSAFDDLGVDLLLVDEAHYFKRLPVTSRMRGHLARVVATGRGPAAQGPHPARAPRQPRRAWHCSPGRRGRTRSRRPSCGRPSCSPTARRRRHRPLRRVGGGVRRLRRDRRGRAGQCRLPDEAAARRGSATSRSCARMLGRRARACCPATSSASTGPTARRADRRVRTRRPASASTSAACGAGRQDPPRPGPRRAGRGQHARRCAATAAAPPSTRGWSASREDSTKIAAVADRVARIHAEHRDTRFAGSDVPGRAADRCSATRARPGPDGLQTYGRLRHRARRARRAGRARCAGCTRRVTPAQRVALFADCRAGQVSVLLGSTDTLGVGANIQTAAARGPPRRRAVAAVGRRAARGPRVAPGQPQPRRRRRPLRHARHLRRLHVADARAQGAPSSSSCSTACSPTTRASAPIDDLGEAVLSYAEVKALATGNPLLLEQA